MATPVGRSGAAAIQEVQDLTSENTFPTTTQILRFLNQEVEDVVTRIGGIKLWQGYPTANNQTTLQLNSDVLQVISANFSYGNATNTNIGSASPFAPGSVVIPLDQLDQTTFMDVAAGFPAVGFGPPSAYFVFQDENYAPKTTLPVPPTPQLSIISLGGINTNLAGPTAVGVTLVNPSGETTISPIAQIAPKKTEQVQVASPPAITNATGWNAYAWYFGGPYHLQNLTGPIALGTPFNLPATLSSVSVQPPSTNTAAGSGAGGSMSLQLYPSSVPGQVNIYYRARPQLWADTTANSWTNLDSSAQSAVVTGAVIRVLQNRSRLIEVREIWGPKYEAQIERLIISMGKRTQPRTGQVRDVLLGSFSGAPWGSS